MNAAVHALTLEGSDCQGSEGQLSNIFDCTFVVSVLQFIALVALVQSGLVSGRDPSHEIRKVPEKKGE
jgi:hypothetical protein